MEPLDVHSAPLHAQLLRGFKVVSAEVPVEKKCPQPETVSAEKSCSKRCQNTQDTRLFLLMHNDYAPACASHLILCQGA